MQQFAVTVANADPHLIFYTTLFCKADEYELFLYQGQVKDEMTEHETEG